jgi:protein O-mannosyl-transferase
MANKTKKKIKKKNITKEEKSVQEPKVSGFKNKFDLKKELYAYLTLIVFGFILYSNTINHDYALDDAIVITQNKFTQSGISGISDIFKYDTFTGFWLSSNPGKTAEQIQEEKKLVAGGRYRPLSLVSFAIELEFAGKEIRDHNNEFQYIGNPKISHFNNILLYILTCIILYMILRRFFPSNLSGRWYLSLPFLVSLLFMAHPIHTEAVANIKGRDEIMVLLGSLLAMWFTLKYLDTEKKHFLIFSGLFMFLGLLSKENAITFLAMIPISVYYFTNHPIRKNMFSLLPLLAASGIFLLIRGSILGMGGGEKEIAQEIMNNPFLHASDGEKFATIFFTLWMYLRLLFFPHPLTYDYYPYQVEIIDWANPAAFLPLLLYIGIGAFALYGLLKKKDVISYSIWFYLIPLSVVSNMFFPVGTFMNERFVFISSIGFCIFLGYILYKYIPKLIPERSSSNYVITLLILVILCLYSIKTISRNNAWENDLVLFTTDVETSFNSAKSTCSAGGKLLEEAQKPHISENKELHDEYCLQAIEYLERSLEIYPDYIDALNLMGNAQFQYDQNVANALKYYNRVLRLRPGHPVSYNNSRIVVTNGHGLLNAGNSPASYDEILEQLIVLLSIRPDHPEANHLAGTIYGRFKNDLNSALPYFDNAEKYGLDSPVFFRDFAVTYGLLQNYSEALNYFLKSLAKDPNDIQTYYNVAVTYMQLGNTEKSNEYFAIYNERLEAQSQQQ